MEISVYGAGMERRAELPAQPRRTPQPEEKRGNYDRVTITGAPEGGEKSFARILAERTASEVLTWQVPEERVEELAQQVAQGLYQPDPWIIAGRMLGIQ